MLDENLSRLWSSIIIKCLKDLGSDRFFFSPGMRNAPLLAAALNTKNVTVSTFLDERVQAYRALGYAKVTGKPAVLVCTSGTALANYFPAVIEASKSKLPLIILSADRPPELALTGANQTINQNGIYGEYVRYHHNLGVPTEEINPEVVGNLIFHGHQRSMGPNPGPVHFNCPFRAPLDLKKAPISEYYLKRCTEYLTSMTAPSESRHDSELNKSQIEELKNLINQKNLLVVVGELSELERGTELTKALKSFGHSIYLDASSGIKYEFDLSDGLVPTFDHPEVREFFSHKLPEAILHLGGKCTSKFYEEYLGRFEHIPLYQMTSRLDHYDPSGRLNRRILANPKSLQYLQGLCRNPERPLYHDDFNSFVEKKSSLIEASPLTYPTVSKFFIDEAPEDLQLFLGNSTVIRCFDSYASENVTKKMRVFSNRGVSGIEGLVSSAIGVAENGKKTILFLGDVSLVHDLGGLALLKDLKIDLSVVVVNNGGGGIFQLLPVFKEESLRSHLLSDPNVNFEMLCQTFRLDYQKIKDPEGYRAWVQSISSTKGPKVIEVIVDRELNDQVYQKLKTISL